MTTGGTGAVVLAAGGGSRFHGSTHKLLASLPDGRTVVEHAVAAALEAGIGPVAVVAGAVPVAIPPGAEMVRNDRWREGLGTSLAAGVAWALRRGLDAIVVGLGDQPAVVPEAWRLVAAATAAPVAVATYGGARGHPVRLAAEVWDRLPATGDEGARALLGGGAVRVAEVPCPGSPADVDTVEDLTEWS